ncbi:MAG: hypothetical protein ACE5GZ_11585 [Gammaproteobacteria bacterium]
MSYIRPDSFYLENVFQTFSTFSFHGVVLHPCSRASLYRLHPWSRLVGSMCDHHG